VLVVSCRRPGEYKKEEKRKRKERDKRKRENLG
jgi:hypothetical protein